MSEYVKQLMTEVKGESGIDFFMNVCKKWETIFNLPNTKKILTITAIVLRENGGAFSIIKRMTKLGLVVKQGNGNHFFYR